MRTLHLKPNMWPRSPPLVEALLKQIKNVLRVDIDIDSAASSVGGSVATRQYFAWTPRQWRESHRFLSAEPIARCPQYSDEVHHFPVIGVLSTIDVCSVLSWGHVL